MHDIILDYRTPQLHTYSPSIVNNVGRETCERLGRLVLRACDSGVCHDMPASFSWIAALPHTKKMGASLQKQYPSHRPTPTIHRTLSP